MSFFLILAMPTSFLQKIIKAYRNENIFYQTKSKNYDYPYLENWEKTINFILKESKLI